jgi:predicted cupin superfamily sugar epimerase/nucleoside phosphorylase
MISSSNTAPASFFKRLLPKIDFAIFSAMPEELEYVQSFFQVRAERIKVNEFEFLVFNYLNMRILLAHSGLGTTFASSVLTLVHNYFNPKYVLFTGVAGGIDPSLKICDVIIVEQAFEAELQNAHGLLQNTPFESCLLHPLKNSKFPSTYSCDKNLLETARKSNFPANINLHYGIVATSNNFPAPISLFEDIKIKKAMSIDMETSAFYQVAWLLNIPILAVRGISNLINSNGTDENIAKSDLKGSAKAAGLVLISILENLIKELSLKNHNIESNKVDQLINKLGLQPHPEGGYYATVFTSEIEMKAYDSDKYDDEIRSAGTSIYYLLDENDFSAFHKIKSDELWHHYQGSPLLIHEIDERGGMRSHLLGNPNLFDKAKFQVYIKAGNWFSAEPLPGNGFALVGCTVSPGFNFKDFTLANRDILVSQFPQHKNIITRLTRIERNEKYIERKNYISI